eukprot:1141767-Pelagomonas_calceolata.AAC.5
MKVRLAPHVTRLSAIIIVEPGCAEINSLINCLPWFHCNNCTGSVWVFGHTLPGPAIIINDLSTIIVEPGCTAHITHAGDVRIDVGETGDQASAKPNDSQGDQLGPVACDPIQLAIFSHRFMGIAEQMGRTLQRTSVRFKHEGQFIVDLHQCCLEEHPDQYMHFLVM